MILTSNRGFAEWTDALAIRLRFNRNAGLDRLMHHAVVTRIEGASSSYRLAVPSFHSETGM